MTTIKDKCRRCYSCVRHCPARAIKVEEGQAKVIEERCVGCGDCVRVCMQSAKEVESGLAVVEAMLDSRAYAIAGLAPSFPAAFPNVSPGQVIAATRALGFAEVGEVAFGAELLGEAYATMFRSGGGRPIISTACPAVVAYVQRHMPALVPYLAPVVSPMTAYARVVKQRYRPWAKFVFIGPCIAKKGERKEPGVVEYVDAVLTFKEFGDLLNSRGVDIARQPEDDFNGPRAGVGRIFPVTGGLLRTAALAADVMDSEIAVASGKDATIELLRETLGERLGIRLLDVLFCDGCIDGPRIQNDLSLVARRKLVADFARRPLPVDRMATMQALGDYRDVDLRRSYQPYPAPRLASPTASEIESALRRVNKVKAEDELNCGACGYPTCREKAVAVCQGMAEAEMCLPFLIEQLEANCRDLQNMHQELQEAQSQLIQSEKLASMGQLAAGVAHEVNNPLGTILLCGHMLLRGQIPDGERMQALRMVIDEATRCKTIVSGLLNFARQGKLALQVVQLNDLICEIIHVLERQPQFANVAMCLALDTRLPPIQADPAQLKDVLINLLVNGAEAMPGGGTLTVTTGLAGDSAVRISIADTGCGIPEENMTKIFNPFFTTKQIGQGTGLGLAISYGIVKMHKGQIDVRSEPGHGAEFTITLPKRLALPDQWLPTTLG